MCIRDSTSVGVIFNQWGVNPLTPPTNRTLCLSNCLSVCIGNTALIHSAYVGNDVAIGILIRSFRRLGLNINHVNADRQTALLVAARHGFLECAALLATVGRADVTVRDPVTGCTAEELARARGCTTPEILPFAVMSAQVSPRLCQQL